AAMPPRAPPPAKPWLLKMKIGVLTILPPIVPAGRFRLLRRSSQNLPAKPANQSIPPRAVLKWPMTLAPGEAWNARRVIEPSGSSAFRARPRHFYKFALKSWQAFSERWQAIEQISQWAMSELWRSHSTP